MKPFFRIISGIIIGVLITVGSIAFFGYLTQPGMEKISSLPKKQTAVITHIAGSVYIIRGNETLPASPGKELQPGDVVKVTSGALAQVQMADHGSALLESDTLVRFLKLTGADSKIDLKTEILIGSLSYRVAKLNDSESITIEVDGTEYEVKGTRFIIEKTGKGSLLIVGEGKIKVSGAFMNEEIFVGPEKQFSIQNSNHAVQLEEISHLNRTRLASTAPIVAMPFGVGNTPEPVHIELVTDPPDSVIYIDGLKTGSGRFRCLLPTGSVIDIRVRHQGFKDYTQTLNVNSDQRIEIHLEPSGLDETLAEKKPDNPEFIRLQSDFEQRLSDLRQYFADISLMNESTKEEIERNRSRKETERVKRENELQAQLEMERTKRSVLETELAGSKSENEKLKDLIIRIQELTE